MSVLKYYPLRQTYFRTYSYHSHYYLLLFPHSNLRFCLYNLSMTANHLIIALTW
jgi:hypothetical protein